MNEFCFVLYYNFVLRLRQCFILILNLAKLPYEITNNKTALLRFLIQVMYTADLNVLP